MIKFLGELLKKMLNRALNIETNQRKLDHLKIQNGNIFFFLLKNDLKNIRSLDQINFNIFSQSNEDAILEYLILCLNLKELEFIEIGTEDYSESNTRYIFEKYNCKGLIVDNTKNLKKKVSKILHLWKGHLDIVETKIDKNNINSIISVFFSKNHVDIFSLDIDGIDYWIINELPNNISKIFIAEYNPFFGPDLEVTVPYTDSFDRSKYHPSNLCWGMSFKALVNLMHKKGYQFIGSNFLRNNAFFINRRYFHKIHLDAIGKTNLEMFTKAKYRESRDCAGNLIYLNPELNLKTIKKCKVFDLKTKRICRIEELI